MEPKSISVVVPTHGRAMKLARLLASLDIQKTKPLEVVVVSDSNDNGTEQVLDRWESGMHPFDTHVLKQEPGKGPASARNLGTKVAAGDVVAFTDDDCLAHPLWIENLSKELDPAEKIVGVGGRVLPIRQDLISQYYSHYRILEPPSSLDYLVSANCCYLRDKVIEVGGFEEDIRKPGGEDVGLSFRLARKQWKFGVAEDAIIYHDYRSNVKDLARTFWNYGQGCRRVTQRYNWESKNSFRASRSRGGYGYGPLSPSRITMGNLTRDTLSEFVSLRHQVRTSEVLAFPLLRVVQRLAYYYGWQAG